MFFKPRSVDKTIFSCATRSAAFTYTIWGTALAFIIYLSIDPPLWPFAQLLGLNVWYPIASLAYTGGTLNIMVCALYAEMLVNLNPVDTWPQDTPYYWKFFMVVQIAFLSLALGVVLSLLVERPLMQLGAKVKILGPQAAPVGGRA